MDPTDTSNTSTRWGGFIDMPSQHMVQIALLGVALGFAAALVALLVRQVVLVPLFCGDPTSGPCLDVNDSAANISAVIIAVIGLLGLIRLSVFRPLLVVVAVLISLWGLGSWTHGLQWYEALAWSILLYALCYVAFSWLVRPRSFVPTAVIVVVAVVLIRWLPML